MTMCFNIKRVPDKKVSHICKRNFFFKKLFDLGQGEGKKKKPWLQHYPPDVSKAKQKTEGPVGPTADQTPLTSILFPDAVLFALLWKSVVDAELPDTSPC